MGMEPTMIHEKIQETKLLPLYTATDLSCLDTVEQVLIAANVRLIEVTFRSNLALSAIKKLAASGELIVGAGTVRTLAEAKDAVAHGAKFIVSPAVVPDVISYCQSEGIAVFPGTATPNDIQRAVELGINTVKFFPANIYGGLAAIKALSGPFYDVSFLPTGGISEDNILDFLAFEPIIGVGGSFILSEAEILKDNGLTSTAKLKKIVEKIKEI